MFAPVGNRLYAMVVIVGLLSACGTAVDLGGKYDPPPILMPNPVPEVTVESQPVTPSAPVVQPLPPVSASDPSPNLVTLSTHMDGASAMPPARSGASGQIDMLYNSTTRELRWKISWQGLSAPITGVQFHGPASTGQTGPATMILPGPFGPSYEGRAMLTSQQAADLTNGLWYINVQTATYPKGEIRGQLKVVQ